jgi:hypothetical protein
MSVANTPDATVKKSGVPFLATTRTPSSMEQTTKTDTQPIDMKFSQLRDARRSLEGSKYGEDAENYLTKLEKAKGDSLSKSQQAYDAMKTFMNKNSRADFWENMIQALGQVAAGGAGLITKTPVGQHYKPVDVYNPETDNKRAELGYQGAVAQNKQSLESTMEQLKQQRDFNIGKKTVNPAVEAQTLPEEIKMTEPNLGKTVTKNEMNTGVTQIPQSQVEVAKTRAAVKPPKEYEPNWVESTVGTTEDDVKKRQQALQDVRKNSRIAALRVEGKTLEEQATSFGNALSIAGIDALSGNNLFKYVAGTLPPGTDPNRVRDAALNLIDKIATTPTPPENTREAYEWRKFLVNLTNQGINLGMYPTAPTMDKKSRNQEKYTAGDPTDIRNKNAWVNTPEGQEHLKSQRTPSTSAPNKSINLNAPVNRKAANDRNDPGFQAEVEKALARKRREGK